MRNEQGREIALNPVVAPEGRQLGLAENKIWGATAVEKPMC